MNTKIPTIDKIITASIDLFYKNSYANTTLQDISKASGAAIGSIYHAFPNGKKDIAIAIDEIYIQTFNSEFISLIQNDTVNSDFSDLIQNLLDTYLKINDKFPCYFDKSFVRSIYTELEADEFNNNLNGYITNLIQTKNPKLERVECELRANLINKIWDTLLEEYYNTKNPAILDQIKTLTYKYLQD
jgi:AcrR family transcriptional regulator